MARKLCATTSYRAFGVGDFGVNKWQESYVPLHHIVRLVLEILVFEDLFKVDR